MIQLQQNTEKFKYKQIFRSNENNSHTCVEKIQKMKCKMQTKKTTKTTTTKNHSNGNESIAWKIETLCHW